MCLYYINVSGNASAFLIINPDFEETPLDIFRADPLNTRALPLSRSIALTSYQGPFAALGRCLLGEWILV